MPFPLQTACKLRKRHAFEMFTYVPVVRVLSNKRHLLKAAVGSLPGEGGRIDFKVWGNKIN